MTRVYYRGAVGAIVVCDVSMQNSLESITSWVADINSKLKSPDGGKIPIVLAVNKCDLPAAQHVVTEEKIQQICQELHLTAALMTSAKLDASIDQMVNTLVRAVMQQAVGEDADFISDPAIPIVDWEQSKPKAAISSTNSVCEPVIELNSGEADLFNADCCTT